MINLAPHGGDALGATPGHPLLTPALSAAPGLSMSRQQALLDLQAIQRIPGLAGYWPADPAYIYQDSAGYIPATVGGVFGQVRDISNAATPVARRNLLTYTEQFDNGVWTQGASSVTAGVALAPDGTLTAEALIESEANAYHFVRTAQGIVPAATSISLSCYIKPNGRNCVRLSYYNGTNTLSYKFNVATGTLMTAPAGTPNAGSGTITSAGNGWYRCTLTGSMTAPSTQHLTDIYSCTDSGMDLYDGDGTSGIYLWGAQLELGAEATPYQKIVTGTGDVFAPGNHAYQQTTANKPYLRRTPTSNVHWLDSNTSTSALTATLGNLGAACTVAQAGAEGVTFTEGVTISSTYNIATAFGFNSDIAIFNRALTVTEKALLTRYMQRGVPVLSAEYVANGEFDSSAAWTLQSGVTIENGKLVYNDAYVAIENSNSFTGGLYYLIKSKALTVTSRAYCIATASVSALSQDISTAGTYSEMLYVGDTSKIHVRAREGAGTYTIDYVSVRAVL